MRWTDSENKAFYKFMEEFIASKAMPPGSDIDQVRSKLGGTRTTAQIRSKVHNLISGKQTLPDQNDTQ